MNRSKQLRMENPARMLELNPEETLSKLGLDENDVICDVGAGSGIFAIPAARITKNKVYALEIDDEMLEIIGEKAKAEGITNIELIKVEGNKIALRDHTADFVLMVTVLHEIESKTVFLKNIKHLLRDSGKIMVIEFHKRETPMGPPTSHRLGIEEVKDVMREVGFLADEEFSLGDNFYCLTFQNDEGKNGSI